MRGSRHGVWLAVLPMTGVVLAAAGLAIGAVPAAGDSGTSNPACPASNPPNALSLAGGSPQTALLHTAFGANLQVALANTNGCPLTSAVPGVPVTFSAPASGASGTFASSGSSSVTVGSDASGMASGAMFSANGSAGSYTIVASSAYGSVSFAMTNTAAGIPAALKVVGRTSQSATVSTRFEHPLEVRLLDANGSALASVSVTFTLGAGGGGSGASGAGNTGAGATFTSGVSQAVVTTDRSGIAVSPHVIADSTAGHFTATATLTGGTKVATFALTQPCRDAAPRDGGGGGERVGSYGQTLPDPARGRRHGCRRQPRPGCGRHLLGARSGCERNLRAFWQGLALASSGSGRTPSESRSRPSSRQTVRRAATP